MAVICDTGSDGDVESGEEEQCDGGKGHQGFAGMGDVISKILEKPLSNNSDTILCKSKKSKKRKLEIKEEYAAKKEKQGKLDEKREKNHVIPTRSNAQQEVLLKRIATKGVVKLFNAVNDHQKLISEKMKEARTEAQKSKAEDKVKKSDFMDILKKNQSGKSKKDSGEDKEGKVDVEKDKRKQWDVLRDDFMMGGSFKDWDKVESDREESSPDEDSDSP